jgi:ribosomal protein S18 acetylase RimI-like enzyme
VILRRATGGDGPALCALLREVAAQPGGLARGPEEITDDHVAAILARPAKGGLVLLAEDEGLIGMLQVASPAIVSVRSLLTDLTVAVHPAAQGRGVGRALFTELIRVVTKEMPHIQRIELHTRASNAAGLKLYTAMGFEVEGRLRRRIRSASGELEDDLLLAWLRP